MTISQKTILITSNSPPIMTLLSPILNLYGACSKGKEGESQFTCTLTGNDEIPEWVAPCEFKAVWNQHRDNTIKLDLSIESESSSEGQCMWILTEISSSIDKHFHLKN